MARFIITTMKRPENLNQNRKGRMKLLILIIGIAIGCNANAQSVENRTPLEIASLVANRIIDQTNFSFEYVVQPIYRDAEIIDFGNLSGAEDQLVAYALTTIYSPRDQSESLEIGFSGGLKIWINDSLVFRKENQEELAFRFREKTYDLPFRFDARLKKGENKILIKSVRASASGDWKLILQSRNLGRYAEKGHELSCSLQKYAPKVSVTNWLILGAFAANNSGNRSALDFVYEPELQIQFYKTFESAGRKFSWSIPPVNIMAQNTDGGRFIDWNYHVGGFMWGLRELSVITGNDKYKGFANQWCDHILSVRPLAEYQTKVLHAVRSSNWSLAGRPMLDYTTAPTMPFLIRLNREPDFDQRGAYSAFTEATIGYVLNDQFRLENGLLAREYTTEPSVWADDMFMGLPFLLQTASYLKDQDKRAKIYDDVASQVLEFRNLLRDKETGLYKQACYASNPGIKIPFWSRGNGWVIWSVSEVLSHLPRSHPQYKNILMIYRDLVQNIVRYQDAEGYWHNLVNLSETEWESSGTAIFTMAIARGINRGWLDRKTYYPAVEKGWTALKTFIEPNGDMNGVKGGTNFSPDPEDYARTPIIKSDTHGIFPLIFACIEIHQLLNK